MVSSKSIFFAHIQKWYNISRSSALHPLETGRELSGSILWHDDGSLSRTLRIVCAKFLRNEARGNQRTFLPVPDAIISYQASSFEFITLLKSFLTVIGCNVRVKYHELLRTVHLLRNASPSPRDEISVNHIEHSMNNILPHLINNL